MTEKPLEVRFTDWRGHYRGNPGDIAITVTYPRSFTKRRQKNLIKFFTFIGPLAEFTEPYVADGRVEVFFLDQNQWQNRLATLTFVFKEHQLATLFRLKFDGALGITFKNIENLSQIVRVA
jgi:hypothetical protein